MKSKFKERGQGDQKFQLVADMVIRYSYPSEQKGASCDEKEEDFKIANSSGHEDMIQNIRLKVCGLKY